MKPLLTIIFVTIFSVSLFAPAGQTKITILYGEVIRPYDKLIHAIGMVESSCDTLAYNPRERAVGYFQIRPIRVRDFNNRAGKDYLLTDMYDFDIALEVFLFYCAGDYETISKNWNASKTERYWRKIKKELNNL